MTQIALIGCAHIHTPGFVDTLKKQQADFHVKYVFDPTPARAEKWAKELGAKIIKTPARALKDPEIAGVVICSETTLHKKLVLLAAKARKHMFVEKPLGIGAKDSAVMAKAIEDAGVIFQTGYFMRSSPINQFLKAEVAKGTFGKISRVRGSNCHSGSLGGWFDDKPQDPATSWRWMADPTISGVGAFGDLGTHSLDILMWLMGDVASVNCQLDNGTARYPGCDETGEALIRFKNGVIGTLAAGWVDVANPVSLVISGTQAHAAVINGQLYFKCQAIEGADGKTPWTQLPAPLPHAFNLFLDAVKGVGNLPLVRVAEAAARSTVMAAMYRAATTGKTITL